MFQWIMWFSNIKQDILEHFEVYWVYNTKQFFYSGIGTKILKSYVLMPLITNKTTEYSKEWKGILDVIYIWKTLHVSWKLFYSSCFRIEIEARNSLYTE